MDRGLTGVPPAPNLADPPAREAEVGEPDDVPAPPPATLSLLSPRVAPVVRRTPRSMSAPVVSHLPVAYGGALVDVAALSEVPEPGALSTGRASPGLTPRPAEGWLPGGERPRSEEDPDPRPTVVPLPSPSRAVTVNVPTRPRRPVEEKPPLVAMTALGLFGLFIAAVIGAGLWAALHAPGRHVTASPLSPVTVTRPAEVAPQAEPPAEPTPADPSADAAEEVEAATAEEETGTPVVVPAPRVRAAPPARAAVEVEPEEPAVEDPWAVPAEGAPPVVPVEVPEKKGILGLGKKK